MYLFECLPSPREHSTPPSGPSSKGEGQQEADDDDIGPMPMPDAARKKRKGTWVFSNPDLSSQYQPFRMSDSF